MPAITLPDGSVRRFEGAVTGTEIASAIGPGLLRAALAMKVDGKPMDLSRQLTADSNVVFITRRDPEALEMIRHDAAHVLAEAVQSLYPGTQVTIGPSIENGFYYDFARNEPFTPEDFAGIEAKMREIVAKNSGFVREEWEREKAIAYFAGKGENYKAELIRDLPETETITIYRQGEWLDLCRGPHMRGTGDVGNAFKLMKVARRLLARRSSQRDADTHLRHRLARPEGARRLSAAAGGSGAPRPPAHRRREMDLFHIQEEAVGSIFWHPKGWKLYRTLESYMRRRLEGNGYQEVKTPQLVDPFALGAVRPLGKIPRAHVHRDGGGRGKNARAEADELPMPCANLQAWPAELPRIAAAHGGVRLLSSLRALRRAARHHARARLHPGRRAYFLHRGPDPRRDGKIRGAA